MDISFIERFLPMYVTAAQLTLTIALIGIAISVGIGIAASLALYYRIPGLRQLVAVYVELSRNTPLLVQLFFLYFGLPKIGIRLSPELCGIIGLSFLGGAYMTETFRAGLETVERIQTESALSLGMSRAATMRYIVLPQAMAVSVPSLVANSIFLIKETSVFSGIALADLMYVTKDLIGIYYQTPEALFMLVMAYLVLLLPISLFGSWVERRLRYAGFGN
jgi:amino ABC transporter, permease protein, 3-TM region, his/glu/gln/arg/opine family